ncbi:tetratricopeptide repeat protein [uncultured Roseibium sp.]|uniref:tetratricopeptide repeat protein n=1 Tax=uncultured Roseibium sp. TaxID=1936171 RepID=UPI00261DFCDB|nr:tetratricopeptide repeat protein [uncultured Roseibium sp.]
MTAAARQAFEEAQALENAGDLDKALVSYLKAQELSPQDMEIAYRTASALLQAGYLEEAQSQLRRIVFAEPDHLSARASLGNCHLLLGDIANARQNFTEVLDQAPDNRNALFGLASVLLKDDKPAEAEAHARHLLSLLPDSAPVLTLFAETQDKSGQTSAAIAAYRKALKSAPDHVPALLGLSETLLRRKRFDEVIELTIRANSLIPADPLPMEMLSDALAGKGDLEDAREAAEEALRLSPRSVAVLVRLSVLSRKLGRPVTALKHAVTAHDLDETAQGPLNALGAGLAALKYSNQARSVLTALSAGKGLEPDIKRFVEALIENEAARLSEEAAQSSDTAQENGGKLAKAPLTAASNETELDEPGSKDPSPPKGKTTLRSNKIEAPAVEGLTGADDQVPNVLGLQRQDRS